MIYIEPDIKLRTSLKPRNQTLDDMIYPICRKAKFVNDGIGEDYIYWDSYNPVVVGAQTGMGKNTFVEKTLIPFAEQLGWQILIISNRVSTNRQQKKRIAKIVGCEQYLENFTTKGLDTLENFEFVRIMTYQKLDVDLNNLLKHKELSGYNIVIFDEAHFFMSDALFNNKTGRILKNSLQVFKNSIRIYMTATEEEILPVIVEKEKLLWEKTFPAIQYRGNPREVCIKPKEILYYNFKRNYSYINVKYFNAESEILEVIKNDKSNFKWLVFVTSKEDGRRFVEHIGENSTFVAAESKDSNNSDGKAYSEIIDNERFSCRVLVTTSVLDNGVNFKDNSLKNIVIFAHDKTELVQMLGRKRIADDERINVYICGRTKAYFNNRLRQVNSKIEAICCFKNNPSLFLDRYFFSGDSTKYDIVKHLFYKDENLCFSLNDLATKKLYNDKIFMENLIDKFNSGIKEAFILEQLSWLGLKKTYNPQSCISYVDSDKNKANFIKFLDDTCNTPLTQEEFYSFSKKFKEHVYAAYGKQDADRTGREYKETKMRTIFSKYNLDYSIEIKNKIYTLRKTI